MKHQLFYSLLLTVALLNEFISALASVHLKLKNELRGDVTVIDPSTYLDGYDASKLFFPYFYKNDAAPVIYPQRFRVPSYSFSNDADELMRLVAVDNIKDATGNSSIFSIVAVDVNYSIAVFDVRGVAPGYPPLANDSTAMKSILKSVTPRNSSDNCSLGVTALQFWDKSSNNFHEIVYCQNETDLVVFDSLKADPKYPNQTALLSRPSTLKYLSKNSKFVKMVSKFEKLTTSDKSDIFAVYPALNLSDSSALNETDKQQSLYFYLASLNQTNKELIETEISIQNIIPSQTFVAEVVYDIKILNHQTIVTKESQDWRLIYLVIQTVQPIQSLAQDVSNLQVLECLINLKAPSSLLGCKVIFRMEKPEDYTRYSVVSITVSDFQQVGDSFSYSVQYLTSATPIPNLISFQISRSLVYGGESGNTLINSTVVSLSGMSLAPEVLSSAVDSELKNIRIVQFQANSKLYLSNDRPMFFDITLTNNKRCIVYNNTLFPEDDTRNVFALPLAGIADRYAIASGNGYIRFLECESPMLVVNTSQLTSSQVQSSIRFCEIADCRTTLTFTVEHDFQKKEFSVQPSDTVCAVVKGYKSRLRFDFMEIKGPLYDINYKNQTGELTSSSVNKIIYYNYTGWNPTGEYPKLDLYAEGLTGTMDLLFSYKSMNVYKCRRFADNFDLHTISVLCKLEKALTGKVPKLEYNKILTFQNVYDKIAILYTRNTTSDVPAFVDVCYFLLDISNLANHNACFSNTENNIINYQMAVGPKSVYFFFSLDKQIRGAYIDWTFSDKKNISTVVSADILSITSNLVNPTVPKEVKADILVAVTTSWEHVTYYYENGDLKRTENRWDTSDTLSSPSNLCRMEKSILFASSEDIYTVDANSSIVSLYNKELNKDPTPRYFNLRCISNKLSLIHRPVTKRIILIRDNADMRSERLNRQLSFDFITTEKISYDYFSNGEFYIVNKALQPYHMSLHHDFTFLQTNTPRGNVSIVIKDIYDESNSKEVPVLFESVEVKDKDDGQLQDRVKSAWKKEKGDDYSLEVDLEKASNSSHFWGVYNNSPLPKDVSISNRFVQLPAREGCKDRCSAYVAEDGIEICYVDNLIHVSKAFDCSAYSVDVYSTGFIVDFVSLRKSISKANIYYLLSRVDKGGYHTLDFVTIDISKKTGAIVQISSDKFPIMSHEQEDLRALWINETALVGRVVPEDLGSLALSSTECNFLPIEGTKYVDFYQLASSWVTGSPNTGILLVSTFDTDDIKAYRVDALTCSVQNLTMVDFDISSNYFSDIECSFHQGHNDELHCVFGGAKIFWIEFKLEGDKIIMKSKEEYYAYKNMEVQDIMIAGEDFFILKVYRKNDNEKVSYDHSGLVYYRRRSAGGSGYMSGGINNLELLQLGAHKNFRLLMTDNRTLVVPTSTRPAYFNTVQPKIKIAKMSGIEKDQGLEVNLLGNSDLKLQISESTHHDREPEKSSKWIKVVIILLIVVIILTISIGAYLVVRGKANKKTVYDHADLALNHTNTLGADSIHKVSEKLLPENSVKAKSEDLPAYPPASLT